MTTAIEFLRVLPSTKDEIRNFAQRLRNELDGGTVNPLELVRLNKSIEAVFKDIKTELDALALAEAEKYGAKTFEAFGMKITVGENGTSYDYDNCQDPKYIDLKTRLDQLQQKIKDRQEFLKAIKAPETLIDEETGDVCVVNPPIKKSTTGLKISLV